MKQVITRDSIPRGAHYPYQENRSNLVVMLLESLMNRRLRHLDKRVEIVLLRSVAKK